MDKKWLIQLLWIGGLTVLFEGITCLFRFGFGLQSTRDTAFISKLTFGFRIHHGYIGLVLILIAFYLPDESIWKIWSLRIGGALIASDLIHHFVVLWLITGDPQFDIRYPRN